ncbi:hypothetical protein [Kribbella kalugense]|uniref:Uncharacterized protein n=1 Tax=Kribbella kalugense TaxID=2512221 RepID=A0A4R7ZKA0_9ACTN|nr:hypothetical protein [Kribbella kalugense]TDW18213.1 hypothetical protein EV650_4796 [Kribbella kalugense]
MRRTVVSSLAGAVALTAAAFVPSAHAASTATTEACWMNPGSVTAKGLQTGFNITAGTPPTMTTPGTDSPPVFPAGKVRLSSSFEVEPSVAGADHSGYVVEGDTLFSRSYNFNEGTDITTRIGGGWTNFTALEVAHFEQGKAFHSLAYGLRNDGTLFRWTVGTGWRSNGSATGFASVKSMALISKTATYDTFLANTRSGALYTIRIPVSAPMKPIVTKVRPGTWQGFETMIAQKCGNYGTLLLGIDKDTGSGYLYAVGHANGASTVINSLGKVSGTFPDPVYFRWGPVFYLDPLNGD